MRRAGVRGDETCAVRIKGGDEMYRIKDGAIECRSVRSDVQECRSMGCA